MEKDVKSQKLTDVPRDFRVVFSTLRDLATEFWDAAERLEAAYGVAVDALNEAMQPDDCMLVLVSKPGFYGGDGADAARS